ncbi:peptide deformylase [Acetobacter nitrogenifigens DSM 23921 = NBRC 105050]|uniref:Peptide deformylase n=1 Tax=Acetobacter nitrogenifigens DSM 23921 = NBRC 105050 TaxID=1120919 RepID=A0A511X8V3_9PROT|nr:peptide deformylase [Acetobacter nitrogenifigens]GBQ87383.1 peptide deformylase [Acetobacter nitrogenifigens DSM 23921 = NBRC 105050]GEN59363.1 peptide deformylase [Acetobacter nitrogenifigens DSM 23921 = NBRC 105050]
MALLKIARMGHPVLLTPAQSVDAIDDPAVQSLIDDMIETMFDAAGAGLAAPQVHVSKRIIVYRTPPGRVEEESDQDDSVKVLVNPVLKPSGVETTLRLEGCLSIPGLRGWVPRYTRVFYEGYDRRGDRVAGEVGGFQANVLQHEVDHLDGVLYPMRMTDLRLIGFDTEAERHLRLDQIQGARS